MRAFDPNSSWLLIVDSEMSRLLMVPAESELHLSSDCEPSTTGQSDSSDQSALSAEDSETESDSMTVEQEESETPSDPSDAAV